MLSYPVKANVSYPRRKTGRSYFTAGISTVVAAANVVYFTPIFLSEGRSIAALVANVTTLAAGNVRLGIYADNGGTPGALLYTAGTASTGTTGVKSVAFAQALPAGVYWLACQFDAAPTMSGWNASQMYAMTDAMIGQATAFSSYYVSLSLASAYAGGLPASGAGAVDGIATVVPLVGYTA